MTVFIAILLVLAGLFVFVVFFGAPYLPTYSHQADQAITLLGLKPGQTLLELGCGDGRVLLAAAKRGVKGVGYELNPILALISRLRTWQYRDLVEVRLGNYWQAKWPKTDGIYVFLLQNYMKKLDKKIIQSYSGKKVKLVSLAFTVPDKKPKKEAKGLYLYQY